MDPLSQKLMMGSAGGGIEYQLWSWGDGVYGQLALGNTTDYSSPVQVGASTDWSLVEARLANGFAIKTNGTLWGWGLNFYGTVGDGTTIDRSSPVQIGSLTTWSKVIPTSYATFGIKTDGTLWSWGYNNNGNLGLGDTTNRSSPVQVGLLTNWKNGSGVTSSVFVKTDGTMWSWGEGIYGQLGDGTVVNKSSPVQIGSLTTWDKVSTGRYYAHAIKTDGTLWAWGLNSSYQLGDGTATGTYSSPIQIGALTNWKLVSGGYQLTMAIKTDGTLWWWGQALGYFGLSTASSSSPQQVGSLTTWSDVKVGYFSNTDYAILTKTDGTLWAIGFNTYGNLGDGTTTTRSSPVQIGSLSTWVDIAAGFGSSFGIKKSS